MSDSRARLMNIARTAITADPNLSDRTKRAIHEVFERLESLDGDPLARELRGLPLALDDRAPCESCEKARAKTDAIAAKSGIAPGLMPIPADELPQFLDNDGVLVALTGRPGIFGHSIDIAWWPCPRFGGVIWQPSGERIWR